MLDILLKVIVRVRVKEVKLQFLFQFYTTQD